MNHADAQRLAAHVIELLAPACQRIEVAGSIRRERAEVQDIELVAVTQPRGRLVFGEPQSAQSPLDRLLADLVRYGELAWDEALVRRGSKYKRLSVRDKHTYDCMAVDLFLATPENFGNIYAIRTGDAAFSRLLVTRRSDGGLMPNGLHHEDGFLWRNRTGERLACRTESAFFAALGVDAVPEPAARSEELIAQLRAHAAKRSA